MLNFVVCILRRKFKLQHKSVNFIYTNSNCYFLLKFLKFYKNIFFKQTHNYVQTCIACLIKRSVFNITPSAASTNMTAPSQILRAAVTSSEKLT